MVVAIICEEGAQAVPMKLVEGLPGVRVGGGGILKMEAIACAWASTVVVEEVNNPPPPASSSATVAGFVLKSPAPPSSSRASSLVVVVVVMASEGEGRCCRTRAESAASTSAVTLACFSEWLK